MSSGNFVEMEGVYLIAVTASAKDSLANFCVRRNNTSPVACSRIGQPSGDAYHSGASVIAQPLHVNDTICVDTDYSIESGFLTYLTIKKLLKIALKCVKLLQIYITLIVDIAFYLQLIFFLLRFLM